jgi:hypothetical protein
MTTRTTAPTEESHRDKPRIRQLPVRMPDEVYNALKGVAYFTGRSMNEIVVAAVTEFLRSSASGELDEIVARAQEDYRQVLDQLADL